MRLEDLEDLLNHRCGLLGISGASADVRSLRARDDSASLDESANAAHAEVISSPGSCVQVMAIPTDEEQVTADDAVRLLHACARTGPARWLRATDAVQPRKEDPPAVFA